ncbi:uncharacterized protein LOC129720490 [Wyeomyia smithii]|uniref:uncharacterized protein LOC129720490 n=1 Tax=Wyeomyia smithii TaxID=174621 RepID=UPI002467E375|nr:uncharacterized protein LOC129720490 [Wyeomyia smithii]
MWRRVNALTGKRRQTGRTIQRNDGTYTNDPLEIANLLGDYFAELSGSKSYSEEFLKIKTNKELNPIVFEKEQEGQTSYYNQNFSMDELLYAISSSKGKSTGHDNVAYPMLHNLPVPGKAALLRSINDTWQRGIYPDKWRKSITIPIPKQGKNSGGPADFRPISLTSCLGKVVERMVNRRLVCLLEEKELLDHSQFGFRKGRGTGTYLMALGDIIDRALTDNLHIDVATLDLSKAYNCTWRHSILSQLKDWGIKGNMGHFIQGFLSERRFQVAIGDSLSSLKQEINGVPQGSVLAVTLFLIQMNGVFEDLPSGIYILVYAEDIILIATGPNATRVRIKIQTAIKRVANWAKKVGFSMAIEKCAVTHICHHHHNPWGRQVVVNNVVVPLKKTIKIIGVTIDRHFDFKAHFANVKKEAQSRSRLVRTISRRHQQGNRNSLLLVGNSILTSKLLYGIEITAKSYNDMIKILSPEYNKMIRNCSGLLPSTPAISSCIEAGTYPFEAVVAQSILNRVIGYLERTTGDYDPTAATIRPVLDRYPAIKVPPIPQLHRVGDRRWDKKGPKIDLSNQKHLRAGDPPSKAQAVFQELIRNNYPYHQQIFTDGPKTNDTVGIGISSNTISASHQLPNACSIFSAEAAAIHAAITGPERNENEPTIILSDSASVLMALEKGSSRHPWIQAIEEACTANITICWIPGHTGISGNDEADKLANLGRHASLLTTEVPGMDIKNDFRNKIKSATAENWRTEQNQFLRKIKGDTEKWTDRPSRREQQILSRLRTGHTLLTHGGLYESGRRNKCDTCKYPLTVEHILVNCPVYQELRATHQIEYSIRDALSNDPVKEQQTFNFLRDAEIYDLV